MSAKITERHDGWLRIGNFEDSKDSETGYPYSSLFRIADFGATIRSRAVRWEQRTRNARPKAVMVYEWEISRQRTDREPKPLDRHGCPKNWESCLAEGSEPTMAKAKSVSLARMKQLRAAHIAAGGDVGYGDAPTGEQIRAATS